MSGVSSPQGDPGDANRGLGQERVDEPSPAPRQRSQRPPAAGGPGKGVSPTLGPDAETEEDKAQRGAERN